MFTLDQAKKEEKLQLAGLHKFEIPESIYGCFDDTGKPVGRTNAKRWLIAPGVTMKLQNWIVPMFIFVSLVYVCRCEDSLFQVIAWNDCYNQMVAKFVPILEDVIRGEMSSDEWKKAALEFFKHCVGEYKMVPLPTKEAMDGFIDNCFRNRRSEMSLKSGKHGVGVLYLYCMYYKSEHAWGVLRSEV